MNEDETDSYNKRPYVTHVIMDVHLIVLTAVIDCTPRVHLLYYQSRKKEAHTTGDD
jgi:hypothetical protein